MKDMLTELKPSEVESSMTTTSNIQQFILKCFKVVHKLGGWKSTSGHLNYIQDMHEVQGIQPRPFNRVCCRGVAARAGMFI